MRRNFFPKPGRGTDPATAPGFVCEQKCLVCVVFCRIGRHPDWPCCVVKRLLWVPKKGSISMLLHNPG